MQGIQWLHEQGAVLRAHLSGRIEVEGFAEDPPATVAVTFSAPALARRSGTTPEAIRASLETLDGVRY